MRHKNNWILISINLFVIEKKYSLLYKGINDKFTYSKYFFKLSMFNFLLDAFIFAIRLSNFDLQFIFNIGNIFVNLIFKILSVTALT